MNNKLFYLKELKECKQMMQENPTEMMQKNLTSVMYNCVISLWEGFTYEQKKEAYNRADNVCYLDAIIDAAQTDALGDKA